MERSKIISHLISMKAEGENIEAIDAAIKIINHYEKPSDPVLNRECIYICPCCRKKVKIRHSHCHHCGKRLRWTEVLKCKPVNK